MRDFLRRYPWIWALLLLLISPFPFREGIKQDAAVYTALARNAYESGVLWPLHLSPAMFPKFYEHPPGIIWGMLPFFSLPGPIEFIASLFSKLCTLGIFLLGLKILPRFQTARREGDAVSQDTIAFVFILLLGTWGQFLKYTGTAQLEGPTALVALAFVALWSSDSDTLWSYLLAFVVGAAAMLSKGILFVPLLAIGLPFALVRRERALVIKVVAGIAGFAAAVAMLSSLDVRFGTGFQSYYWSRLFNWGAGGEASDNVFLRLLKYAGWELRYAAAWTLPFYAVLVWRLFRRREDLSLRNPATTALVVYFALCAPIALAQTKLVHWTVPLTPIAAVWLASRLPLVVLKRLSKTLASPRVLSTITLVAAVALAVIPYPTGSRFGRGEHYIFHRDELVQSPRPLTVVVDHLSDYSEKAFSALYLGPRYEIRFVTLAEISSEPCPYPGRLWVHPGLAAEQGGMLDLLGWKLTARQHERIRLFECRSSALAHGL